MKFKNIFLIGSCLLLGAIQGVYASYNPDWHGRKAKIERVRGGEELKEKTGFCLYSIATNKFFAGEKNTADVYADSKTCLDNSYAQFYIDDYFYYETGSLSKPLKLGPSYQPVSIHHDYLRYENYQKRWIESRPRVVEAEKADATILKATPYAYTGKFEPLNERGLYVNDMDRGRGKANGKSDKIKDRVIVLRIYQ